MLLDQIPPSTVEEKMVALFTQSTCLPLRIPAVEGQAAMPVVIDPLTHSVFAMTSANSSAYSQFPAVAKSHFTELLPVANTTKRTLNITPLNDTGTRLYHAALN
jgi:hypothetical protein